MDYFTQDMHLFFTTCNRSTPTINVSINVMFLKFKIGANVNLVLADYTESDCIDSFQKTNFLFLLV